MANRVKVLYKNYIEARHSGHLSGYDIRMATDEKGDQDLEHYYILIQPKNGLYKGHSYVMELKTQHVKNGEKKIYPIHYPYARFLTDVYHTNIAPEGGGICVDILKDQTKWMPTYSFDAVIQNILILFEEPNNASPWNAPASRLYMDCEKIFNKYDKSTMTIKEIDEYKDKCFAPFVAEATRTFNSNDLAPYYKYFPQLAENGQPDLAEQAEFDQFVKDFESKFNRKALKLDSIKQTDNEQKNTSVVAVPAVDNPVVADPVVAVPAAASKPRWKRHQN